MAENELPQAPESQPTTELPADAPNRKRRIRAAGIFMRHHYEKKRLADCWREVRPQSKASDASAATTAWCELRWLLRTYPLDISNRLEAHGLGEDAMLEDLAELKRATIPLKKGVRRRTYIDPESGETVVEETILYEDRPELRTRVEMLKLQAAMHGHGSGAARKSLSEEQRSLEEAQRMMDEPQEIPTTIEEAIDRGDPITLIEHPEDIPPEQWKEEWARYSEERRRKRAAEDPLGEHA